MNANAMHKFQLGVIRLVKTAVAMSGRLRGAAAWAVLVPALGLSQPIRADHAATTEGWGWWGNHQCLYVWNGASWALTDVCVVVDGADSRVWNVYSLYGDRQIAYQVDARDPNWFTVRFPDVGAGPATWSVPNRGSIWNMFNVELESIFVWSAQQQRWYSFAEVVAAANVQATPGYDSGTFVIGPGDVYTGVTDGMRGLSTTVTIGGGCALSAFDRLALVAAGQSLSSLCSQ